VKFILLIYFTRIIQVYILKNIIEVLRLTAMGVRGEAVGHNSASSTAMPPSPLVHNVRGGGSTKNLLKIVDLRQSQGFALAVDDDRIRAARNTLAKRGLFVEATSAVPLAALDAVRKRLGQQADILIPLSGTGLNESL
jgi:cysteine synthase